jgi:hypothetical protein
MVRHLAPAAALLLAVSNLACGASDVVVEGPTPTSTSLDVRAKSALPSKSTVAVGTPSASAAAPQHLKVVAGDPGAQASTVGGVSSWYLTTVSLAGSVNGSVIAVLGMLETITELPGASCTATTCTWGPGSGPLEAVDWKLVVNYVTSTDSFTYAFSGRAKAGGDGLFHDVLTGTAKPSALPHRGSGTFTIDNAASHLLNPTNHDQGNLQVSYSNATPGQGHLDVTFLGFPDGDHPGQNINAVYRFDEAGTGNGGGLEVATHNLASGDRATIHSRWKGTGAGRSDAAVSVASPQYAASLSECWGAPPFRVTYFTSSAPFFLGANSGTSTDCAFPAAATSTLQAP